MAFILHLSLVLIQLYASTLIVDTTSISADDLSKFFFTTKDARIEVSEADTTHLTVRCSFSKQQSSDFNDMQALILSKSDLSSKSYSELSAVSQVAGSSVEKKDTLGAEVSGIFSSNNESYITYKWTSIGSQVAGRYYCEAHGSDGKGHPRISVAQVDVNPQSIEKKNLLNIIKDMKSTQEKLEVRLNKTYTQEMILETKVARLSSSQEHLNNTLQKSFKENEFLSKKLENIETSMVGLKQVLNTSALQNNILLSSLGKMEQFQKETQTTQEKSWNATMKAQTSWHGHTYFLSHKGIRGVAALDSVCRLFGGYLVEIDNEQEYDFVTTWTNRVLSDSVKWETVAIGATDGGYEGTWTMLRSGKPMTILHWDNQEPNGKTKENCLFFAAQTKKMFDASCYVQFVGRFMCEVP